MYTIIFDWKRTLYDPENKALIDGARELLCHLQRKNAILILIGKGGQEMYQEVEHLQVKTFFDHIIFKDRAKDKEDFRQFVRINGPQNTIFIGDRIRSELLVGNSLKAKTLWVKQGKFSDELPENTEQEPTFTVSSLTEALLLLQKELA